MAIDTNIVANGSAGICQIAESLVFVAGTGLAR
jgi:hypothetical protein